MLFALHWLVLCAQGQRAGEKSVHASIHEPVFKAIDRGGVCLCSHGSHLLLVMLLGGGGWYGRHWYGRYCELGRLAWEQLFRLDAIEIKKADDETWVPRARRCAN